MEPGSHRIDLVVFDRFQLLDATGPAQVFATSNEERSPGDAGRYDIRVVSPAGGLVASSSGICLQSARLPRPSSVKGTIVFAGGPGVRSALQDAKFLAWTRAAAANARRVCSVCTGSFLLGAAGLLDGRAAVTHWRQLDRFSAAFPSVEVHGDPIFLKSGKFYSSAGVTAGIDLSLSLVEEDHGRAHAIAVAKRLVVYMKRPGGQMQFSSELLAQATESTGFEKLLRAVKANPGRDWSIEAMADIMHMSARTLHRRFVDSVGTTPSRFVASARLEKACMLIERSNAPLKTIAATAGFGSGANMKNAFGSRLGITPQEYQSRFRSTPRRLQ